MLSNQHTKIIIFGAARSASTFCFHSLVKGKISSDNRFDNDFNLLRLGGEPFRLNEKENLQTFNNWPSDNWIAKLHLLDLLNLQDIDLAHKFIQRANYKLLLLRRNLLQATLSMCISVYKNQWVNDLDTREVTIPEQLFIDMLHQQWRTVLHLIGRNDWNIEYDRIMYTEDIPNDPNTLYEIATDELTNNIVNEIEMSPNKNNIIINIEECKSWYHQHTADLEPCERILLEGEAWQII